MKMDALSILRIPAFAVVLAVSPFHLDSAVAQEDIQLPSAQVELLVKLRPDVPIESGSPHTAIGATVIRSFEAIGWQLVRLPIGMPASEGVTKYKAHSAVAAVERNSVIRLAPPRPVPVEPIQTEPAESEPKLRSATANLVTPNDPRWSAQWNLRKIGMPAAWAVTTGSSDVVVAVMDTGVDYTHEDLRDNMWRNPGETGLDSAGKDKSTNGIDDDGNGYIDDVHGIDTVENNGDPMDQGYTSPGFLIPFYHGTACAGFISAVGNNRTGIAGVSWSSRILAVRVYQFLETDVTWKTFEANVLEAYNYILEQRRMGVNIRMANNSWGELSHSHAIKDVIETAARNGILTVTGVLNEEVSSDLQWMMPANLDTPYLIAVAASSQTDQITSSFGAYTTDLAAPGAGVYSLSTNASYYQNISGSSFAGPTVCGAAALLWSIVPEATPLQIKAALMQSVDQTAGLRGKLVSHGRLNVARALGVITNTSLPAVVVGAFPASSQTETVAQIEVWFNAPMDRDSVESALQFSPAIAGAFEWSDEGRVVRLRPETLLTQTNYTARLLGTARTLDGQTIDGDFDRNSEGSPADDFVWGFRFGPVHDQFANAFVLTGGEGSIEDNTTNTSMEPEEPLINAYNRLDGIASLWYEWTAESDGWITFDTSTFLGIDTVVAAYASFPGAIQPSTLDELVELGYSDDFSSRRGGRISFPVQAETKYFVTVGGKWFYSPLTEALGPFTLSWYPTPAPSLRPSQFFPRSGMPGANVTISGTNFTGATEVLFNGARAVFSLGLTNNADLRVTATVPPDATDGPITIRTPHGDVTSTFEFTLMPPPLAITSDGAGTLEVSWPATSPALVLESAERLENAFWSIVEAEPGTNGKTTYKPARTAERTFYRLRKD